MFEELNEYFALQLSKLLARELDNTDYLAQIGSVYSGVMSGDKVGILSRGTFKNAIAASCNPAWTEATTPTQDTWALANFMIPASFCYDNFIAEIKRYQQLYTLDGNSAAQKWVTDYMKNAFNESVIAKGLFGSTVSGDYTSVGFGGINGILTLALNAIAGGASARQTTIATNTNAALRTGTTALDALTSMIADAPIDVKASKNAVIIMNQAFYDALAINLINNKGFNIESQWTALSTGLKIATIWNYKVVIVPMMDRVMASMVSGDKFFGKAGVALFTSTDNILFGSSSNEVAGVGNVDVFDDKPNQMTKAIVKYSLGALIADETQFQLAI